MTRILIVDDVLELGKFLQAALATMEKNLDIHVVATAEEALLEATRLAVDLLVTEVRLPGISGIDLVRRVRNRYPQMKVIFMSTLTNKKIDQQVEELNADAYFHKPMQIPLFLEAAAKALKIQPGWELTEEEHTGTGARLSDRLTDLRQTLHARGVYLLDDHGRVLVQAGEESEDKITLWSSAVMSAMNASHRLARMLAEKPHGFSIALRGEVCDMVLAPVGDYVLMLTLESGRANSSAALAFEEMLYAQNEIAVIFQEMGIQAAIAPEDIPVISGVETSQPETPSPVEVVTEEDAFAQRLAMVAAGMDRQAAEEFWKTNETSDQGYAGSPDALSYEQAQKLGIAPSETGQEIPREGE